MMAQELTGLKNLAIKLEMLLCNFNMFSVKGRSQKLCNRFL